MGPSNLRRARRALVIAIAAGAPALVACNALLGLDDYDKVVCTGGRCDGGTEDVAQDVRSDVVVVQTDAAGTQPVAWAQFRMPNYDAGDAQISNPIDYEVKSGEIFDKVTELTWQDQDPAGVDAVTFARARTACPVGWRLPTRIELVTLLDLGNAGTRVDPRFPGIQPAEYWTTSEVRPYGQSQSRWTVVFDARSGDVLGQKQESQTARVRCIKVN